MNKQSIIIFNFDVLFQILFEIRENLNFELFNFKQENKIKELDKTFYGNYLIISKNKIYSEKNLVFQKFPIPINKLVEEINICLLKQKYNEQSEVNINQYLLNINSRKIFKNDKTLKLTEREIEIILFLKKTNIPQNINSLKKEVWEHNSILETHTVETHIYRLRKKIKDTFNDTSFIKSSKKGYFIE